ATPLALAYALGPKIASNLSGSFITGWTATGMRGARIDTSGAALDSAGFAIGTPIAPSANDVAAVSWASTNYLVVYAHNTPMQGQSLMRTRVDPTGAVLGTTVLQTTGAGENYLELSATWNGASTQVLWQRYWNAEQGDFQPLTGHRIDPAGNVL